MKNLIIFLLSTLCIAIIDADEVKIKNLKSENYYPKNGLFQKRVKLTGNKDAQYILTRAIYKDGEIIDSYTKKYVLHEAPEISITVQQLDALGKDMAFKNKFILIGCGPPQLLTISHQEFVAIMNSQGSPVVPVLPAKTTVLKIYIGNLLTPKTLKVLKHEDEAKGLFVVVQLSKFK